MKMSVFGWLVLAVLAAAGEARSDYLYWTDNSDFGSGGNTGGDIRRANTDGTGQMTLVRGLVGPYAIALDAAGGRMYWTNGNQDNDTGDIRRAGLDGSSPKVLVRPFFPVALALDPAGGQMYWIQHAQQNEPKGLDIHRANLDGTGNTTLVHTPVQIGNGSLTIDVAGGRMYWTDFNDGLIRTANLEGTNPTTLVSGQNFPLGISLDLPAGKMYWTDSHVNTNGQGGDIRRANLDGTGVETVLGSLPGPGGLALDLATGKMYWADYNGNDIRAANLDGSNPQVLVRGLNNPGGVALLVPEPSNLLLTVFFGCVLRPGRVARPGRRAARWQSSQPII